MAVPLPEEDRAKIKEYMSRLNLSSLTGMEISELVNEEIGIRISQPTASRYKREIMEESTVTETPIEPPLVIG